MTFNKNASNKDKAIMQYFPLLALIKKKVGKTKEEKHDKDMSIETWDISKESKVERDKPK